MLDYDQFVSRLLKLLDADIATPVNPYDGLYTDLGFDSLQAFQIIVISERLADVDIPPMDIPEIYTMADAHGYYRSLSAERERSV